MPRETVSGFMSAGSNGFSWLIYLNQAGHECRERWVHMQMFWGVHRISPSEHHNRAGFTPSRAALKEDRRAFEDSRGRVKMPKVPRLSKTINPRGARGGRVQNGCLELSFSTGRSPHHAAAVLDGLPISPTEPFSSKSWLL